MEAASNRLARALIDQGLRVGDRVGLLSANSAFYVEAYYGILKAGGVVVALNTAWDGRALSDSLLSCSARFLIVSARFARLVSDGVSFENTLEAVLFEGSGSGLEGLPESTRSLSYDQAVDPISSKTIDVSLSETDVASIVYTSGSTGRPHGATLSHLNICSNVLAIAHYLELSAKDRVLAVLPFYYVYGKSVLNTHAAVGGSVVIENRFQYPSVALDTLERQRCTGFSGVPSTFAILLNRSKFATRDFPDLRYVTQAGGAMSQAQLAQFPCNHCDDASRWV